MALIKPSATLKYDITTYNPQALRKLSDKEIKTEYTRLRAIARKRLDTISKYEEGRATNAYKYNKDRYPSLTSFDNDMSKIRLELSDLSKFIVAKTSTITGIREAKRKAIDTFKENAMDFITLDTFDLWGMFMKYVKSTNAENIKYNPEGVIGVFDEYVSSTDISEMNLEALINRYKEWIDKNA